MQNYKQPAVRKQLILSIVSGYGSSATMLLVTLFGLPIASRLLSPSEMALYVACSSMSSLSTLGQIGAGSVLTQRVSSLVALGDMPGLRAKCHASLVLCLAMACLLLPFAIYAVHSGQFLLLFGLRATDFRSWESAVGLQFVLLVPLVVILLSPFQRIQSGMQESYIRNCCTCVANIAILIGLRYVLSSAPFGIIGYFCFSVPILVVYAFVAVHATTKHLYAFFPLELPSWSEMKVAALDSMSFAIFELASVVLLEASKAYVGRTWGEGELAKCGVFLFLVAAFNSVALTIMTPVSPVLSRLFVQKRFGRLRGLYLQILGVAFAVIILSAAVFWTFGPSLLVRLVPKYPLSRNECLMVSVVGGACCLRILNGNFLIGVGRHWAAALCGVGSLAVVGVTLLIFPATVNSVLGVWTCISVAIVLCFGIAPLKPMRSILWSADDQLADDAA